MTRIARRMADIQPFHVMEILKRAHELAAAGRDIIHLEVGEPDFPSPPPIVEAAQRFLAGGHVHYTPALGLTALREAISRFYQDRFGADVSPERIIVTPGASGALMLALAVLTDPGDEWLLPDPGYPSNRHLVRSFEGVAKALPVDASSRFQPTPAHVEAAWTPRTRGLMVASPANPTGTLLSQDEIIALQQTVSARDGVLIVDEIYQGLNYGIEASSALSRLDDVFVVNSFSKYFGMTGWRLGWMVVPHAYVREIEKLAQHFFISPSTPAQHAALAAFAPGTLEILEARRHAFANRRNALLPALRELGFRFATEPQGAFYLYADISGLADSSESLAKRLIEEAGVATTPGLDFGDNAPERHLRIAYTTDEARLVEAAERISRVIHAG
ncbi:MAG: pyridoxal phosphate-dependent aminotransferase [Zoogloea oleivorans]|jgi:aspartate/methionine/tyrosine aminotransferase|uniref:pyridoxal phosphate-dependent aminotransferase n=1 Tax=Zoogloea oleivorans TaxID=1552750 RepID=UPI002A363B03|nr:pyridoxal phosphate-dependent aminotransferase [Zoogloea oleivorans]MDY0036022.1 pyridoxal phosphate-dependent aminotransferase [Zoogloea oleivorans]